MSEKKDIVFCTGGGCTAKLGAGVLSRILEKLPRGEKDPNLLVGYDSRDDAAVYQVTEELALVQTVDFFPPMVDGKSMTLRFQSDFWIFHRYSIFWRF